MFEIIAKKNRLCIHRREPITSGSVNACQVRFQFSQDWEGLEKTAVFRSGGKSVSVPLGDAGECAVPREVVSAPGWRLDVGVYGERGGEIVLPSVWAGLGMVLEGAGEPAANPGEAPASNWTAGHGLKVEDGILRVDAVDSFDGDNSLPMTAAGVRAVVGDIEALLSAI